MQNELSKPKILSQKIKTYVALITIGLIIGFLSHFYFFASIKESNSHVDSTIILERIKSVSKLVTTEGYYSNIYHIEDYYLINSWPFRKQATIRVKLKALVGIDLSKMSVTPNEVTKTLYIENIPDVEPIAIDPRIEFFDMSEGVLNQFKKEDLNYINEVVRNMSIEAITNGNNQPKNQVDSILRERYSEELNGFFIPLVDNARKEAENHLNFIETLADVAGWKLIVKK